MTHVLIVGMTESGKTTLAKKLAKEHKRKGRGVLVYDPLYSEGWNADFQTSDAFSFLDVVKRSRSCALFIDESGEAIGQHNDEMFWLATRARHYGHKSNFITQRAAQLSPTVRAQCSHLFMFASAMDDGKILAREFNAPILEKGNTLSQFDYYYATRFGVVRKERLKHLDFKRKQENDTPTRNSADRLGDNPSGEVGG